MAVPITTLTQYYYPELPEYLKTMYQLSDILKITAPESWASAGLYDITKFIEEEDPETGETQLSYPIEWTEDYKEYLEENPAKKAEYIVENIFPELKKISLEHYQAPFPANIPEKWNLEKMYTKFYLWNQEAEKKKNK